MPKKDELKDEAPEQPRGTGTKSQVNKEPRLKRGRRKRNLSKSALRRCCEEVESEKVERWRQGEKS